MDEAIRFVWYATLIGVVGYLVSRMFARGPPMKKPAKKPKAPPKPEKPRETWKSRACDSGKCEDCTGRIGFVPGAWHRG